MKAVFPAGGTDMIRFLLWDVDGTLLDFKAAQKAALQRLFPVFGFGECDEEMVKRYSLINDKYWQKLERGEIDKQQCLVGRYEEFFAKEGLDPKRAAEFNERYLNALPDTIIYRDDSLEIVRSLIGKVKQYIVSNGTTVVQNRKLKESGFAELMDGVFLSEALGIEKPALAFFDKVFEELDIKDKSEVMIIGDSLTSDIQGGINAGIVTCWYNPFRHPRPEGYEIDHEIADLHEIYDLL